MVHSKAPNHEWHHALRCAAYILRRLPTRSNPDRKAPIQLMLNAMDEQVILNHPRTWYSPVFVRKQDPERRKSERFMGAGQLGRFLGYEEGVKGYIVRVNGRILTRSPRDVYFVEDMQQAERICRELQSKPVNCQIQSQTATHTVTNATSHYSLPPSKQTAEPTTHPTTNPDHNHDDHASADPESGAGVHTADSTVASKHESEQPPRPKRTRIPRVLHNVGGSQAEIINGLAGHVTDFYGYAGTSCSMTRVSEHYTPSTVEEAMRHPQWRQSVMQ